MGAEAFLEIEEILKVGILSCSALAFYLEKKLKDSLPAPPTYSEAGQTRQPGRHMCIHRMTLSWAQCIYGNDFHKLKPKSSLLVVI